jgi:hypothetical protein
MKIFIIKSFVFSLIVLTIFGLVITQYKPKIDITTDYMAILINKHQRLKAVEKDRIILVGGSNLAFGINSEKLGKKLSKNVINLGLHAGLGLPFMLNQVIANINTGDVILLNIEYPLYDAAYEPDVELIEHTQLVFPESKKYYSFSLKEKALLSYRHFKKTFEGQKITVDSLYNRSSFNKYGDMISHVGKKNKKDLKNKEKIKEMDTINSLEKFRELSEKCEKMGANVFIVFPPYPQSEYDTNKKNIQKLEELLKKEVNFIPILGTTAQFTLADSCFFDTVYHLNSVYREERTELIAQLLKQNTTLLSE